MPLSKNPYNSPSPDGYEEEQVPEKELKLGYWLTVNRPNFYAILVLALITFDVFLGGWNVYKWADYLIFGYWDDERLVMEIRRPIVNPNILESQSARDLVIEGTMVFPVGSRFDAVSMVSNPNLIFLAKVDYRFNVGGLATPIRNGFFLPGESKPLTELGMKEGGGEATLELVKVSWTRLSPHEIYNPTEYANQRLQFELRDFQYVSGASLGLPHSQVRFKVVNNSTFSYWQAKFILLYTSQEQVVGAEHLVLNNLEAGEDRPVLINLIDGATPSEVKLYPDINVFDSSVFSK